MGDTTLPVALAACTAAGAAVGILLGPHRPLPVAVTLGGLAVLLALLAVTGQRARRTAADLRRSQGHLRSVLKSSLDPIVILDRDLRITYASKRMSHMLGYARAEMVGARFHDVIHPDDAPAIRATFAGTGSRDEYAVRTARVRDSAGRWRLVQATVRDLRNDPDAASVVLYCRDVTVRPTVPGLDSELLELSLTDPVTGLPNRAALVRRLAAVQRAAGDRPYSLVLVGVDGLDVVRRDPATEAAVLRALTSRLTRLLRGEDWLARGKDGDFVVLVDGSVSDAEVVAARLVADIGPLATDSGTLRLSASAGVTRLSTDVDTGDALRHGDLALRSARIAGQGSVHRYDDALRNAEDRRSTLRADLDGALERGELRLVFQPVVDVVLQRTVSVEALMRWRHPEFGDISPVEFVPLAEETPLISQLGRWVLREACATVAGLAGDDVAVAVNVSARHVRSGDLVPDVITALERSGLRPSRLTIEITESVLLDDAHVIEDLAALRRLGVRIAVDDFGTGWSSLAYLVGMPVDVLKMDQHFLAGLEHDPQSRALCRAVLEIGTSLGLPVVVEGVTSLPVLALLRDMGHRYLQGFALSRPIEADRLAEGSWRDCLATAPQN